MSGSFETVRSRRVYDGVLSDVRLDTVRGPGGERFEREVVEHVDAVAVVPVTPEGEVVLVEQYRHPLGRALLEIPAGIRDVDGEPAEATARRELAEEVSLSAERLTALATIHNSAGWSDESTRIFLGEGARPADAPDGFAPEHEEAAMRVVRMGLGEAVAAVRAGEITDAKTVVGLLMAADRLGGR